MKKLFVILALFILGAGRLFAAFEITWDTQIVISRNAPESTRLAAEELADYIWKVSKIKSVVVQDKSTAASQIIIGTLLDIKNLPLSAVRKLESAKSPDAFAIVCCGNKLIIAGRERAGELYGTYAFLEEKMGIRWFRAATGKDPYEYVPERASLKFDEFEIIRDPVFRFRFLTHSGATGRIPVNGQTLAVRQGFQINPPWNYKRAFQEKFYQARCSLLSVSEGGHGAFYTPVPESLFNKHPEYFALKNGKRVKGKQICISNPGVQRRVQKYIEDIYKNVPQNSISWLFGMLDTTTGWCECRNCHKLDGTEKFDYINVSTRFHKVVTKIMAEVYKKYPDAMLEVWAYHTYRTIPEGVKYDPRALIYYCTHGRCYGHDLGDPICRRNVKHLDLIKEWLKISPRMRVYEYANCTPVFYGCMEENLVKDLRLYRKLGLEGWKEEMLFADAQFWPPVKKGEIDHRSDRANSNWQWYCVAGKLLWDPELDPEKILADVESKYYGKAYPAMKKYHDYRRQLWNNSAYCFGYPTGDQRRESLLSVPDARKKLLSLLDEADKLAGDDAILIGRLKDDRDWLQRYWIKPNDEFRKKQTKTASLPLKTGSLAIDGKPDDAEWCRAWHTSDFKYIAGRNKGKTAAGKNKTFLSVLADEKNLYLRLMTDADMKRSGGGKDDCIGFFIIPPDAAKCYAALVKTDGTPQLRNLPENCRNITGAIQAAAGNSKNKYVMEVKIPLDRIGRAENGALWKLHAVRYKSKGAYMSLDGVLPHDKINYRCCITGIPLLRNGTFEVLQKDGTPAKWFMDKCKITRHQTSSSIKMSPGGYIYQLLAGGELGQKPEARKIKVTFCASGQGVMRVYAMRYSDTRNGKAKHGYTRKFLETREFYKTDLSARQKTYSCEYTIAPEEWIGLRFVFTGAKENTAVLKDISIVRIPN